MEVRENEKMEGLYITAPYPKLFSVQSLGVENKRSRDGCG